MHVAQPMDDGQPPAQHFFHTHNGGGDRLDGRFHAPVKQPMPWVAFIGEN
jgi:hypothetical protein